MTEDKAKTKWCPMTRHGYGTEGIGVNRLHQDKNPSTAKCIASDCMMWRKANWPIFAEGEQSDIDRELERMDKSGYCGLACEDKSR